MIRQLSIDIETYSSNSITDGGVYKYVEAEDFTILLFAYAFDDEPVQVVDLASGEVLPDEVMSALEGLDRVTLHAHNAAFERVCINRHFGLDIPAERWRCTMVHSSMVGLPLALDQVARVLKLTEQKDTKGKALIRLFCQPNKVKKPNVWKLKPDVLAERYRHAFQMYCDAAEYVPADMLAAPKEFADEWYGFRVLCERKQLQSPDVDRILPTDEPEKWEEFKAYCRQDVVVERNIRKKIEWFIVPQQEHDLWCLDQQMNDRGVMLDRRLIENAIAIGDAYVHRLKREAAELTGLDNPNSRNQLIGWLEEELSENADSTVKLDKLTKDSVSKLIGNVDDETVKRVLYIRQEVNKTSTSKYKKMLASICADGRSKGLIQFYGAGRTGRDAGRSWQPQNQPKIRLKDIDLPRNVVIEGDGDVLGWLYGGVPAGATDAEKHHANVPGVLSQLIRTAIIAAPGYRFIVSDFKAIEARVIAWLAGETWAVEAFKTHGKIYEAAASRMFNVPMELISKDSPLRDKGKIGTLALGFQGGISALIVMGALDMGLAEYELQPLVDAWRSANPNIVKYWREVENAAIKAVDTGERQHAKGGVDFRFVNDTLLIGLPSGRELAYARPRVKREVKVFVEFIKDHAGNKKGKKSLLSTLKANGLVEDGVIKITSEPKEKLSLSYEGMDQVKKIWCRIETYGGKIVENIVQGVARDCMMYSFLAAAKEGYATVLRVHDELVIEMPEGVGSLAEIESLMSQPIPWAPGLPLGADGFESQYYKK